MEMLSQNYDWLLYTIRSILPQATFVVDSFTTTTDETEWSCTVNLENEGLTSIVDHIIRFRFNTTLFSTIVLTVDGLDVTPVCTLTECAYNATLLARSAKLLQLTISQTSGMA